MAHSANFLDSEHSGSARIPFSAITVIIISILVLLSIAGLVIWQAIKARRKERGDEEKLPKPLSANVIQVRHSVIVASESVEGSAPLEEPRLEDFPHPPRTLRLVAKETNIPRKKSRHNSTISHSSALGSQDVPFYLSQNDSSLQGCTTLVDSSSDGSLRPETQAQRPSSAGSLKRYLSGLEKRFTPETRERTEAEMEGIFHGAEPKKLPRPKREQRQIMVVPAVIQDPRTGRRLV